MASLKVNSYRNYIIYIFLFFIPFSYALTFKVGFPLKISEIALGAILFLLFVSNQLKFEGKIISLFNTLAIFCLVTFISVFINLFWQYDYTLESYPARFGYKFDSILKFGYLVLAVFCFVISYQVFSRNQKYGLKAYLLGAVIAAIYCWYLFMSSLLDLPVLLLPGMDSEPQMAHLSFGHFIRTGTFKEGNYMGMFLLLSGVIAFYCRRLKTGWFLFLTIIPTVSSMAILNVGLFLVLYYFKKYFTRKNLAKFLLFFIGFILIFILALGNKDFKFLVTSKIFGNTKVITNNAELSKADRMNSIMTAIDLGLDNPYFGVGMSNFGLHQKEYIYDQRFYRTFKTIPNNIYTEVFSENGIFALIIFVVFLFQLYRIAKLENAAPLRYGLITCYIYFLAFPTYTVLFIWVYFALVASLPNVNLFKDYANNN